MFRISTKTTPTTTSNISVLQAGAQSTEPHQPGLNISEFKQNSWYLNCFPQLCHITLAVKGTHSDFWGVSIPIPSSTTIISLPSFLHPSPHNIQRLTEMRYGPVDKADKDQRQNCNYYYPLRRHMPVITDPEKI